MTCSRSWTLEPNILTNLLPDRPGVTRSNQWVRITPWLELLDTPGLLWPDLQDRENPL